MNLVYDIQLDTQKKKTSTTSKQKPPMLIEIRTVVNNKIIININYLNKYNH